MAITEQTVMTGCKILFAPDGTQSCEIEWRNQVLKNGNIISDTIHRGAYAVDPVTGDPDQSVQTVMGIKLSKLLTNAGDAAQQNLLVTQKNLDTTKSDLETAKADRDAAKQKFLDAKAEAKALRQKLKDNKIDDGDIPVTPDSITKKAAV